MLLASVILWILLPPSPSATIQRSISMSTHRVVQNLDVVRILGKVLAQRNILPEHVIVHGQKSPSSSVVTYATQTSSSSLRQLVINSLPATESEKKRFPFPCYIATPAGYHPAVDRRSFTSLTSCGEGANHGCSAAAEIERGLGGVMLYR